MADPTNNNDPNPFGVMPPAPDPNDPNWQWDYNWLNPYGNYIANLPNLMPGPLSPNAPSWYFPNSNGSAGSTGAPGSWTIPVADTVSGGNGGDPAQFNVAPAKSAVAPSIAPAGSMLAHDRFHPFTSEGEFVVLPDGSQVPDEHSWTGYLMSPNPDLGSVAAAGSETASTFRRLSHDPYNVVDAIPYFIGSFYTHLGQGGTFDYQRQRDPITGRFKQLPQFRGVSNVNVGLFGHQAGLSLDQTLMAAGAYAHYRSSNADPNQPYGLDPITAQFIKTGYDLGRSGVFNPTYNPGGGG